MCSLVEFWQNLDTTFGEGFYIHPQDKKILAKKRGHFFYAKDRHKYHENTICYNLHVDVLPFPYIGDVANAKIYFYILKPGFPIQEVEDYENETMWEGMSSSIKQDFSSQDYWKESKFLFLLPEFQRTHGARFYKHYLSTCCRAYQAKTNASREEALQVLANNVCFIQAFPYRSRGTEDGRMKTITRRLPSHQAANDFLRSISDDHEKLIFIIQGFHFFDYQIPESGNMIPFVRSGEYSSDTFPDKAKYQDGISHGDRMVTHLLRYGNLTT